MIDPVVDELGSREAIEGIRKIMQDRHRRRPPAQSLRRNQRRPQSRSRLHGRRNPRRPLTTIKRELSSWSARGPRRFLHGVPEERFVLFGAEFGGGKRRICFLNIHTGARARLHSLLKNSQYLVVLKGHGFIRAGKWCKASAALAAEGWFRDFQPTNSIFSELFSHTESSEQLSNEIPS